MVDYISPNLVLSPRHTLEGPVIVLHDGGVWSADNEDPWSGWSIGEFTWDGCPDTMGLRWNGSVGSPIGMPQTHGIAVWVIVPEPLRDAIRQTLIAETRRRVAA